jgi:hypothetical protein
MAKNHQKMTWHLTMGCLQPRVNRFQQNIEPLLIGLENT